MGISIKTIGSALKKIFADETLLNELMHMKANEGASSLTDSSDGMKSAMAGVYGLGVDNPQLAGLFTYALKHMVKTQGAYVYLVTDLGAREAIERDKRGTELFIDYHL